MKVPTEVSSKRFGKEGDIHPTINPPAPGNKRLRNVNYSGEKNPAAVGCKRPRSDLERLPINPPCGDESHHPNVSAPENVCESPSSTQRPHATAGCTLGKTTIVADINSGSAAHVLGHVQKVRSLFLVLFAFRFLIEVFDLSIACLYYMCIMRFEYVHIWSIL